jgi:oligoendopeptidase F
MPNLTTIDLDLAKSERLGSISKLNDKLITNKSFDFSRKQKTPLTKQHPKFRLTNRRTKSLAKFGLTSKNFKKPKNFSISGFEDFSLNRSKDERKRKKGFLCTTESFRIRGNRLENLDLGIKEKFERIVEIGKDRPAVSILSSSKLRSGFEWKSRKKKKRRKISSNMVKILRGRKFLD